MGHSHATVIKEAMDISPRSTTFIHSEIRIDLPVSAPLMQTGPMERGSLRNHGLPRNQEPNECHNRYRYTKLEPASGSAGIRKYHALEPPCGTEWNQADQSNQFLATTSQRRQCVRGAGKRWQLMAVADAGPPPVRMKKFLCSR